MLIAVFRYRKGRDKLKIPLFEFPNIGFVGMEPAIIPPALKTITGVVGVLATPALHMNEREKPVVFHEFAKLKIDLLF